MGQPPAESSRSRPVPRTIALSSDVVRRDVGSVLSKQNRCSSPAGEDCGTGRPFPPHVNMTSGRSLEPRGDGLQEASSRAFAPSARGVRRRKHIETVCRHASICDANANFAPQRRVLASRGHFRLRLPHRRHRRRELMFRPAATRRAQYRFVVERFFDASRRRRWCREKRRRCGS